MQNGAASTRPSSKPKNYQFIEGRPSTCASDADNNRASQAISTAVETTTNTELKESNAMHKDKHRPTEQSEPQSPSKPPPSTPLTRLPLAELVGNVDGLHRQSLGDGTPAEYLTWQSQTSPLRAIQAQRSPTTDSRKRARSSSPASSQTASSRKPGKNTDVHDARGNQTEESNAEAELWHRYALANARDGTHLTSFMSIVGPPSPFAAGAEHQASTVGGLRRWTSCGVEWPASHSKRRKTKHVFPMNVLDEFKPEDEQLVGSRPRFTNSAGNPASASASTSTSLLDRIQQSLAKAVETHDQNAPSSSSPLPNRVETFDRQSVSPCRANDIADRVNQRLSLEHKDTLPEEEKSLGEDMNVEVEHTREPPVETAAEPKEQQVYDEARDEDLLVTDQLIEEEFGDFDDNEEFQEQDLDQLAALYDHPTLNDAAVLQPAPQTSATPDADEFDNDIVDDTLALQLAPQASAAPDADEFGDDDIDDVCLVAAEASASQRPKKSMPIENKDNTLAGEVARKTQKVSGTIQRYKIVDIVEGAYNDERGVERLEKIVLVEDESRLGKIILLRQSWYDTRCTKGAFVHVIGDFDQCGQCEINDAQNMIILHPDHLISALVVADSFSCIRRAVLQDRVKATGDNSPPAVYGTMIHEIFQEALAERRWDASFCETAINAAILRHIEDLYDVQLTEATVSEHLSAKVPLLQAWMETFVRAEPGSGALIKDRNDQVATMSVNKLLDVEEHVWSPMYGLKGNIDATVEVTMVDGQARKSLTVPLEVKTGRNSLHSSHRAQTALYTLLLSDRYDVAVAYGILYYVETSETSRIPAIRHELRHMIMQRNELACYLCERIALPPLLRNPHVCTRCYAKETCFIYHKLAEDGDGQSSGLGAKFEKETKHLTVAHQDFFRKWDDLLVKEESEMTKFRRELWTMVSREREKLGRCFANMELVPGSEEVETGSSKINRFRYSFQRMDDANGTSFTESQIAAGEPVVVSDENGHYGLAKGFAISVTRQLVTVAVDRKLRDTRVKVSEFNESTGERSVGVSSETDPYDEQHLSVPLRFRIDKDEFSNGLATVRNNLVQTMRDDVFHCRDIRRLVIDKEPPQFKSAPAAYTLSDPTSVNEDQRAAIEKIMCAEDYALVLGMPGTGKTTTIAQIIRALVGSGKSVLLTSYTHSAVDNILLKLRNENVGILRIGALAKVHPEVREFAVLAAEPKDSTEAVRKAYVEPQIVATTCLGINHMIFKERIFDYCIVDEASQITLPVCLGPIRMARKFVLVGDHKQLPPLVQNDDARRGGLDVSLFRLLCEAHPHAIAALRHQYRMSAHVMSLSNTLIYNGELVCGSEAIATQRLDLPHYEQLATMFHPASDDALESATGAAKMCSSLSAATCWLRRALDPTTSPSVVFLNTDYIGPMSTETHLGSNGRITNTFEACLAVQLAHALLIGGVSPTTMGLVTSYRSQLALIKSLLSSSAARTTLSQASCSAGLPSVLDGVSQVEALTTDRFQGRDKEIMILSLVRSNTEHKVGELLKDWRRVNVALTRAKSKLILIGSKSTLSNGDALLAKLIQHCDERDWVVDLPASAASLQGSFATPYLAGHPFYAVHSSTRDITGSPAQARSQTRPRKAQRSLAKVAASPMTVSASAPSPVKSAHKPVREPLAPRTPNSVPARRPTGSYAASAFDSPVNKRFKVPAKRAFVDPDIVLAGRNKKHMHTDGAAGLGIGSGVLDDVFREMLE